MNEFKAMAEIDSVLTELDEDEARRVLIWILDKHQFFRCAKRNITIESIEEAEQFNSSAPDKNENLKIVTDVDLEKKIKTGASARQIAEDKLPNNKKQMCAVAVWYFKNYSDVQQVSIDHVYTFFFHVGWAMPADLANTLHQAGSDGLLIVGNKRDIQLTHAGDELVSSQLVSKDGKNTVRIPAPEWMTDPKRRREVAKKIENSFLRT